MISYGSGRWVRKILPAVMSLCFVLAQAQENPEKLSRKNSYFGIHFDLHVSESQDSIGLTLTEEMVDSFLLKIRPDFIQVDSKGHGGISSYPTEYGYQAKGYLKDPLKVFRKVTADHNVALYAHFSGIYDRKVAVTHPAWALTDKDGDKSKRILSTLSPYPDSFLIPQLVEIGREYQLDGAWVDGECWAIEPDFGKEALEMFEEETGIVNYHEGPGNEHYDRFMEFNRRLFKDYMSGYVSEVHQKVPGFEITSNWAFSSLMPEPVSVNLDFLSGDLQATNAVYSAAFESRCLESQEMPWDLMAWSFTWDPEGKSQRAPKQAVQLMQEAAEVISMGGGIQFYFKQNEDLSIQPWTFSIMEELSEFCRSRQEYCYKAEPVPQAAVIFPSKDFLKKIDRVYAGGWTEPSSENIKGCLDLILDSQYPAEILMEFMLKEEIHKYPLVILPDVEFLDENIQEIISQYVREGGNLILAGPGAYEQFKSFIPVREADEAKPSPLFFSDGNSMLMVRSGIKTILPGEAVLSSGSFYEKQDFRFPSQNLSYSVSKLGKGKVAAVYFDLGQYYFDGHNYVLKDFMKELSRKLAHPMVEVRGSGKIHTSLNEKNGKLMVNLINTSGPHHDKTIYAYDEIPPTGPLSIEVKLNQKPSAVYLQPENRKLEYTFEIGTLKLELEKVDVHAIIEVIY